MTTVEQTRSDTPPRDFQWTGETRRARSAEHGSCINKTTRTIHHYGSYSKSHLLKLPPGNRLCYEGPHPRNRHHRKSRCGVWGDKREPSTVPWFSGNRLKILASYHNLRGEPGVLETGHRHQAISDGGRSTNTVMCKVTRAFPMVATGTTGNRWCGCGILRHRFQVKREGLAWMVLRPD